MMMAKTLFEHLDEIYTQQRVNYWELIEESDQKTFNVYMVNRFISMNPDYLLIVNELQQYWGQVTPRAVYLFYSQILPKKRQFNKYVKSSKETQYDEWVVELVCQHYHVSNKEAEEYLHLFYTSAAGKTRLRELLESYGCDAKKIKKAGL